MNDLLRPFLTVLAVLNIGFVHSTGAVPISWLVPLYLLALAAPLFARIQHLKHYRTAWTVAVVAVMLLLVHHAQTTGLVHMLEDGLVLSALCQVHLLNNLQGRQKPDLLFFNSFLITFITAFFAPDVTWSVIFLAYASFLVPAMHLHAVLRAGVEPVPGLTMRVLRDSIPRTAAVLACTGLVFAAWPRDFHRQGWIQERLDIEFRAGREVAFSDEIHLDATGRARLSEVEVMRVRQVGGKPAPFPTHWRGATFVELGDGPWRSHARIVTGANQHTDWLWAMDVSNLWHRRGNHPDSEFAVELTDLTTSRVVLPPSAAAIEWGVESGAEIATPLTDGTVELSRNGIRDLRSRSLHFSVLVGREREDAELSPGLPALQRMRQVDPTAMPPGSAELAAQLHTTAPGDPATTAEHFAQWLRKSRRYALPGEDGASASLAEFVLGHGGGHCEYFAATLAFMLRSRGIPCRLVTGYLASEIDDATGELVIRRRDAHAWTEVWTGTSWLTVDPTPAAEMEQAQEQAVSGTLHDMTAWLRSAWGKLTGFDAEAQARLWQSLAAVPGTVARTLAENALTASLLAMLLGAWLVVRNRSGLQQPPAIRDLHRATRRCGMRAVAGETPRELLERALALGTVPADRLEQLRHATEAHERSRYER